MEKPLEIQDFSIVLATKNHNPTMLTPDFLKGSGVIPEDWELGRPPVLSTRATQVIFKNGVKIEAQPGNISFSEAMSQTKTVEQMEIPQIACRYAASLPNLDYRGVGINPRRFVTFEAKEGAYKYIRETILSPGPWQDFGIAPVKAGINLVYNLERCLLQLAINEVMLKVRDKESPQEVPAISFVGNFHYPLRGKSGEERLQNLKQTINHWQEDLAAYQELIDSKFLARVEGIATSIAS